MKSRRFYKFKRNELKKNSNRFIEWLKQKAPLIILLGLIGLLTFREFKNYYSRISYKFSEPIFDGKQGFPQAYVGITLSTESAFLPFERIRIDAIYYPVSDSCMKATKNAKWVALSFFESEFSENNINENQFDYDKNKPKEEQESEVFPFLAYNQGNIKFVWDNKKQFYSGSAEIIYLNKGDYPIRLNIAPPVDKDDPTGMNAVAKTIELRNKISVDSYTEVSTHKNNKILYVLTISSFLFVLYVEIFKKK